MTTLEVLVSTLNDGVRRVEGVLRPVAPGVRYLITHQQHAYADDADVRALKERLRARGDVRIVESPTRGLSRNRNLCLEQAAGDLLVLADDDVRYREGAFDAVRALFDAEPTLDVVTLRTHTPEGVPVKRYPPGPRRHHAFSVLSVSSVEIAMRRTSIARTGIRFDERFGLGSEFPASEEAIFLADALAAGLNVAYRPVPLAVHAEQSTGSRWSDPALVASKGPLFHRLYGWKGYPLFLAFAVAKWPRYRADRSFAAFVSAGTRALVRERLRGRR